MGNRESQGEPNAGERSDENADDVTQLFRNPKKDERLKDRSGEIPPVPEVKFKRPDVPVVNGTPRPGAVVNIETGGDTKKSAVASGVGVILVASLLVGGGLGWVVDRFILHNPPTPWGMICGLLLGVVVGFYNIFRIATQLQDSDEGSK